MREYEVYLFDADGTLTDTAELIYRCFDNSVKVYSKGTISRDDIYSTIGMPLRAQLELFLGEMSDELYFQVQATHMDFQYSNYREMLTLFDGTIEVLEKLKKQGKRLAIVTSRRLESLQKYLEFTNIWKYFDVVITPESTKKHKPSADPVLAALSQLDAKPENAIFIGDASFDIDAGVAAGVDTAFVNWSNSDVNSLKNKPTYHLKRWDELLKF
jgi:pyrophosphatase PpaX